MRSKRTPAHRSAAFLTAGEDCLPIFVESFTALVLSVSEIDQYLPSIAVGSESRDLAPSSTSFATEGTQRTAVYRSALLVEKVQLGIGQPTRLTEARRSIFFLQTCFGSKRNGTLMMFARVTMI